MQSPNCEEVSGSSPVQSWILAGFAHRIDMASWGVDDAPDIKSILGLCSHELLTHRKMTVFSSRRAGKTSLLEMLYPRTDALWIGLLDPKEVRRFAEHPTLFSERISTLDKAKSWVVIYEVQKVPALLDVVRNEIESRCLERIAS